MAENEEPEFTTETPVDGDEWIDEYVAEHRTECACLPGECRIQQAIDMSEERAKPEFRRAFRNTMIHAVMITNRVIMLEAKEQILGNLLAAMVSRSGGAVKISPDEITAGIAANMMISADDDGEGSTAIQVMKPAPAGKPS